LWNTFIESSFSLPNLGNSTRCVLLGNSTRCVLLHQCYQGSGFKCYRQNWWNYSLLVFRVAGHSCSHLCWVNGGHVHLRILV